MARSRMRAHRLYIHNSPERRESSLKGAVPQIGEQPYGDRVNREVASNAVHGPRLGYGARWVIAPGIPFKSTVHQPRRDICSHGPWMCTTVRSSGGSSPSLTENHCASTLDTASIHDANAAAETDPDPPATPADVDRRSRHPGRDLPRERMRRLKRTRRKSTYETRSCLMNRWIWMRVQASAA